MPTANQIKALSISGMGTITRTSGASTGSQTVTGLGYKPRVIHFFGIQDGVAGAVFSYGMADGSVQCEIETGIGSAINQALCLRVVTAIGDGWKATVSSLNDDGFTLSWTKEGSGSNITVKYIAY